jgi:uncharacterized integral membrane protein
MFLIADPLYGWRMEWPDIVALVILGVVMQGTAIAALVLL